MPEVVKTHGVLGSDLRLLTNLNLSSMIIVHCQLTFLKPRGLCMKVSVAMFFWSAVLADLRKTPTKVIINSF